MLKIRDSHSNTSEEFKSEQARAADVENTLRGLVLKLQQQIKEQSRTKITYSVRERARSLSHQCDPVVLYQRMFIQGKVNAVSAELEKVRAESKRKEERVGRLVRESEKQSKGQTDKVGL